MIQILFVDDEDVFARCVSNILRMSGIEVRLAPSVGQALIRLNSRKPNALVTDWGLPDGTGADVISLCRNRYPKVPALIQTASPEQVTVSGVRVMVKPYQVDALVDWLRRSVPKP